MKRNTLLQELWAEFFGTLILIVFGVGVVANVLFAPRLSGFGVFESGAGYDWHTITIGWGMAVAMAVYVAGGVTGAHINPAVTLAALFRRGLGFGRAIGYWIAQVLGAFAGAFLVYQAYRGNFIHQGYMNIFYTGAANEAYTFGNSIFTEILGTFFLVLFIYAIVDAANNLGPGANLWPLIVGFAVYAIGLSLGGPTGYAINPARDLGPRIFALLIGDTSAFAGTYWLIPIIGPLVGGALGAFAYDFLVTPCLPKKMADGQKALGA